MNNATTLMKLLSKTRQGAKVKKVYHKPATPCERLLAHASVAEAVKEKIDGEVVEGRKMQVRFA